MARKKKSKFKVPEGPCTPKPPKRPPPPSPTGPWDKLGQDPLKWLKLGRKG